MGMVCPLECLVELVPDQLHWHQHPHDRATSWVYDRFGYRGVIIRDDAGRFHATLTTPAGAVGSLIDADLGDNLAHAQLAVQALAQIEAGTDGHRALTWTTEIQELALGAREIHTYHGPFDFLASIASDSDGPLHLSVFGPVDPICCDQPIPAVPLEQAKQHAIAVLRNSLCADLQLDVRAGPRNHSGHCRYSPHGCHLDPPSTLDHPEAHSHSSDRRT